METFVTFDLLNIEVLLTAPYSPDANDFHLYGDLKRRIAGIIYKDASTLKKAVLGSLKFQLGQKLAGFAGK